MEVFSVDFRILLKGDKQCLDCAGASGLGFRPFIFSHCASTLAHPFCHCFLIDFGTPWEPSLTRFLRGFYEVGVRGGTPLNEFN